MAKNKMSLKTKLSVYFESSNNVLWCILISFTLIFTLFLYPDLNADKYSQKLGDIAKRDIKSPRDFFVIDTDATEMNRLQAVRSVLDVYDHDTNLALDLTQRVRRVFSVFRDIFNDKTVSPAVPVLPAVPSQAEAPKPETTSQALVWAKKDEFEQKLGIKVSKGAYQVLEKAQFPVEMENLICQILFKILDNGVVANKEILLRQAEKGISLRSVDKTSEVVEQSLKRFYSLEQAQTMVRIVAEPLFDGVDYNVRNVVVDFSQRLLQPNITLNRSETEAREKRAESEIAPTMFKIKAGEMLLREGERVSRSQLLKLKALQNQTRNENLVLRSLGVALLILLFVSTMYVLHLKPKNDINIEHNKNMLFLASIMAVFLFITKISLSVPGVIAATVAFDIPESSVYYGMPIAASAMTVCLFMGLEVALPFCIVFSALVAILFENQFEVFIFFLLSTTMAAYWTRDCSERKVFIKAGAKLGLLNVFISTAVITYFGDFDWHSVMWGWLFALTGGVSAGIVTAGLAPLVEILFDYTTDIKLLELANLEQPILRRLMIEAPGTYNHSVIVGTMADAVASEIGANPLLARVCGYYHDIGKIDKAQYFIENQQHGKNKHDKLAPSMSALILTGHVKNGVEMAKKYRLGKPILDTIRQHHGTSLIEFFFEKAKTQKIDSEETVNPADFRYPGPKPQTVEAGIVMIADVVEAASRTLDDPTPARIQGLVQRLINKIFSDGQLDYCEITLKDLHNIAKRFNQILSGIHHHRIKYPEKGSTSNGKVKNGDSDRQQAAKSQRGFEEDSRESSSHLKRLGIK
ncbi:MAG: HDIG domain-containing protein [Proteobacteria bacterium]|nr:HDIG domain-containing protein [Pseudomonadota bacterium]